MSHAAVTNAAVTNTAVTNTVAPVEAARASAGRTRIAPKALTSLIGGLAADALRVHRGGVRVAVSDDNGSLSIDITTPIVVAPLARIAKERGLLAQYGGTMLERAAGAQAEVRERTQQLTGSLVSRVNVRFSSMQREQERKVQ